jgi:transcription elongation GreA/GreB family factor
VHFGARVTIVDDDGKEQTVHIVGDDEADAAAGDISWASPLARALIGARVGDLVSWRRPAGVAQLEVLDIHYAQP